MIVPTAIAKAHELPAQRAAFCASFSIAFEIDFDGLFICLLRCVEICTNLTRTNALERKNFPPDPAQVVDQVDPTKISSKSVGPLARLDLISVTLTSSTVWLDPCILFGFQAKRGNMKQWSLSC